MMAMAPEKLKEVDGTSYMLPESENKEAKMKKGAGGSRVLGDIGNRLRHNLLTGKGPGGKPTIAMKPSTTTKPNTGPLKAIENFAALRAPRGGGLANRQENVTKPQMLRQNATNFLGALNSKKVIATKPDVAPKVLGGLKNRVQSYACLKDEILKSSNAISSEPKPLSLDSAEPKLETESANLLQEIVPLEEVSKISDEAPTNEALAELKTEKTDGEILEERSNKPVGFSEQRLEIIQIDAVDEKNPLLVNDYILNIFDYLFSLEKKYPVKIRYLEGRLVNSKMRAVLLDWLVEVHYQFAFMPETLYMAAKTLDRYLQKERKVTRKQLQLVGVTSMYIAAKFEEVCTPTVVDFSAVSDNAFSATEVRHMEREILQSLEYDLAPPPAVFFLRRFSKAAGVSNKTAPLMVHTMAKYIMEHSLVDYSTCHLYPSEQAAASLALSLLIMNKSKSLKDLWTATLQHYTRTNIDSLKTILTPVASLFAKICEEPPKLKAIHNKYARNRLSKVSLIPELQVGEWKDRVVKELCE